jgi:ATP-dependent RNA helicase DeaD
MGIAIDAVYGGVGIEPQIEALTKTDVMVATPGRMLDHMQRGTVDLSKVHILVIDEADKMFEMGFIEDVERIIHRLPHERQTLLFSATIHDGVLRVVEKYLNDPVTVQEQIHVDKSLLKQVYYNVRQDQKYSLLVHFLKHKTPGLAIVFCATRTEVDVIERNLKAAGINALAVHGGLSQNKRSYAVDSLKQQDIQVLVATDVAARGLDIKNISHIYNYDSPKTSNEYTHRIGRTARAGEHGEAVTLLTDKDHDNFRNVLRDTDLQIQKADLPEFQRAPFVRGERYDRGDRPQGRFGGPRRGPSYGPSRGPPRGHGPSRGPPRQGDSRPPRRYGSRPPRPQSG